MHSPVPSLFLFFFFLCFAHGTAHLDGPPRHRCPPTSCPSGPRVRFPFWFPGRQGPECGYKGFELICDDRGRTALSVPNTSQPLLVESIDYKSQSVVLHDPTGCLPLVIANLTQSRFSASKLYSNQDPYNYVLFKCPPPDRDYMTEVACRSKPPSYRVYAVESSDYVGNLPLVYCERSGSVDPLPNPIDDMIDQAQFEWTTPDCKKCAEGLCGWNGSKIECFPPRHGQPGIVLILVEGPRVPFRNLICFMRLGLTL